MPIDDDQQDEGNTAGYDESSMGDVISQDEYNNSPEWFKERMGKMARQKNEAIAQAAAVRSELDEVRDDVRDLRNTAPQPAQQQQAEKPFMQRATEAELKAAALKIRGLLRLEVDPKATPEERAKASDGLSGIGDPEEAVFNIHQEIADRKANAAAGKVRDEFSQHTRSTDARNALVNRLFTDFGQDAINKNSALSKAAFAKIKTWTQEHGLTADQVNDFMTHQAFSQAATELRTDAPGRRGADPRTSPVLGGNVSRQQNGHDDLAVLERRGQQGDWKARKVVAAKKFENWLEASGLNEGSGG